MLLVASNSRACIKRNYFYYEKFYYLNTEFFTVVELMTFNK